MYERLFSLQPSGIRAVLRATGYGSILATFVMVGLGYQPQWWLATVLVSLIGILGPLGLLLLLLQPGVRRWEGWFVITCDFVLVIVLMFPAVKSD